MDKRLLWFVLTGFISGTEGFVIGSLLPSISAELGVTVGEAGYVVFSYALVYAFATPVLATVLGNVDRRTVLIGAELTFALGSILMVLAPTLPLLIAARAVVALGVGLFSTMALTTAIAMSAPERRGRAVAFVLSGQSLATLAGVPLGAFVVSLYNWRVVIAAIAALTLVAAVGLILNLPRGLRGERVTLRQRLSVIRVPGVPLALLSTLLFMLGQFTLVIFIAPLANYAGGIGAQLLPFLLFATGVGAVAGNQLGGRIADRIGARRTTVLAAAAQGVLFLLLAATGSLPPAIGAIAVFAIMPATIAASWCFFMALSSLISTLVTGPPTLALALNLTAMNLGVALAARLGGAILDQTGAFWLALTAASVSIAAVLVASLVRPVLKPVVDRA